ncbi:hypothetical protein RvY_05381 [Ramazzottius varieornatus]|uniref:C3H1-type domain-containing protein n=1 Tax=Ramazzottius varieornatus TaxID=947166 RepID=A0A1D1V0H4_RAMVA|nr:hypothetical protein RvY_05381 [Ramazzottius varieornatus]
MPCFIFILQSVLSVYQEKLGTMNSKMRKWARVTPVEELFNERSSIFSCSSRPVSQLSSLGSSSVTGKIDYGRKPNMLYGLQAGRKAIQYPEVTTKFPAERSTSYADHPKSTPETIPEQDFEYWKTNTLDPLTGRMDDSKILYNTTGEDRGVCRHALLGRACPIGADCPFSHPVRHTVGVRRELSLNMTLMTFRYSLVPGACAVVEIMDVISPISFSVWVHQMCDDSLTALRPYLQGSKKRTYPDGFSHLLNDMKDFYHKHGDKASLSFRSLDDVSDTFVAVHAPFHEKFMWLRGIVMDLQKTSKESNRLLKVRLPDLGRVGEVKDVRFLRRLDQSFLKEPWFAARVELGRITLSTNSVSTPATLTWLKDLLLKKMAFIRILEEYEDPLVEMMCTIDNGTVKSLNNYLVDEMIAFGQEVTQRTGESDTDEDDLEIIPG